MPMRICQPFGKFVAQCISNRSGATATEFALLMTPLMILLMGAFDLGYQAYLHSVVQGAVNDVARSASMEAPALDCTEASIVGKVECAIKRRSDVVARDATYTVTVKNFYDFSGAGRSEKLVTDYNHNGTYDAGDCFVDLNGDRTFNIDAGRDGVGGADDVAFYEVTVTMPRLFPIQNFLPVSQNYEIRGETALRNQPYARQAIPPTVCV